MCYKSCKSLTLRRDVGLVRLMSGSSSMVFSARNVHITVYGVTHGVGEPRIMQTEGQKTGKAWGNGIPKQTKLSTIFMVKNLFQFHGQTLIFVVFMCSGLVKFLGTKFLGQAPFHSNKKFLCSKPNNKISCSKPILNGRDLADTCRHFPQDCMSTTAAGVNKFTLD